MSMTTGFAGPDDPRLETLVEPSALRGSNGIAFAPDGRLWVAQFLGGTVGAVDVHTGEVETVVGPGGPLTAPDDLVFDETGAAYIVDLPPGLIWRCDPNGSMSIVADGITAPDGIAWYEGRLFVNELTHDGRLLELDPAGGPPRVMATGLVLGNAMQVGPDRHLYYPHLLGGQVWRVGLDGGSPQLVLDGLRLPVAVRFDREGRLLVLSNDEHGTLLVHDTESGARELIRTGVGGADNLAVSEDGTLYLSSAFHGGITALGPDGARRVVVPSGLSGPWAIARGADHGLVVADHYSVKSVTRDGQIHVLGDPGSTTPMAVRGLITVGDEVHVTTDHGHLYTGPTAGPMSPRTEALHEPAGVLAVASGLLVVETGAGRVVHVNDRNRVRVIRDGLHEPVGLALDTQGDVYVTQRAAGLVTRLGDGAVMGAGLQHPEGLAVLHDALWCLESGAGRLVRICPSTRTSRVELDGLPLAAPPRHVSPRFATNDLSYRPVPFAPLVADRDALLIGGSADGSIIRFTPERDT